MSTASNNPTTQRGAPPAISAVGPTGPAADPKLIGRPDMFEGVRDKLDDWLNQLELYFMFLRTPLPSRTLLAATFMRGRAQHWFKPQLTKFMDEQDDPKGIFDDFDNFKGEIRQIFGVNNEEAIAERAVQGLVQKTSASDYAAKFQEYSNRLEWGDDALMAMFRRGLKETVKDELMRYQQQPETLSELIKESIEIDDKLYNRAMEKKYHGQTPFGKHQFGPRGQSGYTRGRKPTQDNESHGDPMEIDFVQTKKPFNGKRKEDSKMSEKKCYSCGKPGHFARNCRSKNVGPSRQINVVEREIIDQGEWEFVEGPEVAIPPEQEAKTDKDHPSHKYLCADECEDTECTLVHYGNWEFQEDDPTQQADQIIDLLEKQLGSDPSQEKELLNEQSNKELDDCDPEHNHKEAATASKRHPDHNQYEECQDEDCNKLRHIWWRREHLPQSPPLEPSNEDWETHDGKIRVYHKGFLPCAIIPEVYKDHMDPTQYLQELRQAYITVTGIADKLFTSPLCKDILGTIQERQKGYMELMKNKTPSSGKENNSSKGAN